jgi:hypothetical protein
VKIRFSPIHSLPKFTDDLIVMQSSPNFELNLGLKFVIKNAQSKQSHNSQNPPNLVTLIKSKTLLQLKDGFKALPSMSDFCRNEREPII